MLQEVCGPGERSCGGDKCIAENLFCNGVPDCPDGSDEIPERCRKYLQWKDITIDELIWRLEK